MSEWPNVLSSGLFKKRTSAGKPSRRSLLVMSLQFLFVSQKMIVLSPSFISRSILFNLDHFSCSGITMTVWVTFLEALNSNPPTVTYSKNHEYHSEKTKSNEPKIFLNKIHALIVTNLNVIFQEITRKPLYWLRPSGRPHQNLSIRANLWHNFSNLWFKSHVQHTISLIHHQICNAAQICSASPQKVDHTTFEMHTMNSDKKVIATILQIWFWSGYQMLSHQWSINYKLNLEYKLQFPRHCVDLELEVPLVLLHKHTWFWCSMIYQICHILRIFDWPTLLLEQSLVR